MGSFLFGLAVIPAAAAVVLIGAYVRVFVRRRIERLHMLNPQRRAGLAARLFAARRAYYVGGTTVAVALFIGHDYAVAQRARGVLLDEFVPLGEEGATS